MITIVADENIPFLKGILEPWCRMVYLPGRMISNEHLKNADGLIIRTRTLCDRKLLENTRIRFIASATIGYDHIDRGYCDSSGIKWFRAAGCNSSAVAQYVTCGILSMAVKQRLDLSAMTIGIIGAGNVGTKVARAASLLGMRILLNDPPRERKEGKGQFAALDEVLSVSDIISLHVPLNMEGRDRTFHMADGPLFRKARTGSIIINTSRGPVMDETSLKKHIGSGKTGGAILDVWENEPLIDRGLLAMTSIATPHIAGYSIEGKANGTAFCVRQASRFFGFGIDDWYPAKLPSPQTTIVQLDPYGKKLEEILHEAAQVSYPIMEDDQRLRKAPGTFDRQRNEYPVRREFTAHQIKLARPHEEAKEILRGLGFNVEC